MLVTSLLPLLARYSLGFDLIAGPGETVTLTIIPRKVDSKSPALDTSETRPISITASAAEIDAELALGSDGALGQLIATRRTLADQIAEQRQADEDAKAAAAEAAKAKAAKAATARTAAPASPTKIQTPSNPPADAKPDEPASLF
ncbi:MAG: PRTRC system protein E [Sphingobium sp.]